MSSSAQFATVCTPDDDLALVHASQGGDVAAFEELVRRYDRRLLRIAQHVTDNLEDAEEAVQEAFFKAYRKLSQFRGDAKFSTWLIRITSERIAHEAAKTAYSQRVVSRRECSSRGPRPPTRCCRLGPESGSTLRGLRTAKDPD